VGRSGLQSVTCVLRLIESNQRREHQCRFIEGVHGDIQAEYCGIDAEDRFVADRLAGDGGGGEEDQELGIDFRGCCGLGSGSGGARCQEDGQHLHRVRLERRLRLKQVWEATGISIASLSRIERGGSHGVDSVTLIALCEWMGLPIEMFKQNPRVTPQPGKKAISTPDIVELHLRADKKLDKKTADALATMFRTAYVQLRRAER
jgi:transcriptional regulator with XRE-family HTH domain